MSRSRLPVILLAVALTGGCAGALGRGAGGGQAEERFRAASAAAERGDFGRASRQLRSLAARCESGDRGREAVLLLAAVEIDPRNPSPSPATAAHLAARYLQVPQAPGASLAVAETLYLMALDLGANPVRDPFAPIPSLEGEAAAGAGPWTVAESFRSCGESGEPEKVRNVPEHPGVPLWMAVRNARRERDSLAGRADSLTLRADSLAERAAEAGRLRARADSLEAELRRVRSLLEQDPGGPSTDPGDDP